MSFSTGLSGVAAANKDLEITGNNVANASTTGFKASRAEFGDAYTSSFLGYGQDKVGYGVNVENVGQKFEQGNLTQTNSVLDLAVDGSGFFVMDYPTGERSYTRSGIFGVDDEGFITNNQDAYLQGYGISDNGDVSGVLDRLEVDTSSQPPRGTHAVDAEVNVPAGAPVLAEDGTITTTNGLAIGVAQTGPIDDTASVLSTVDYPRTYTQKSEIEGIDISGTLPWTPAATDTIDIDLQGQNIDDGNILSATLQPFDGSTYNTTDDVVSALNSAILADPDLQGKIEAVESPADTVTIQTRGAYATDGTRITRIEDNVGTPASDLGIDTVNTAPTITNPIAGTDLFASGGSIDLRSDPGEAVAIQGNDQMELEYTNNVPATSSTLTGSVDVYTVDTDGADPFAESDAGNDINFNINIGGDSANVTLTVPSVGAGDPQDGWANIGDFTTDLDAAIDTALAGAGSPETVSVAMTGSNQIEITADTAGPMPIDITHLAGSATNVTMQTLGMSNTSTPEPTFILGDPEIEANNQLDIEIDNSGTWETINIPPGTYDDYDDLVDTINTQLSITPGLSGEVEASHINGRLSLDRTEIGTGFNLDIQDNPGALDTLETLGMDSVTKTAGEDPIDREHSFRVSLTVPAPDEENRSGSVEISLNEEILSVQQLASAINRELASVPEDDYIGVQAEVVEDDAGNEKLQFVANEEGEESIIAVDDIQAPGADLDIEQLWGLLQTDSLDSEYLELGEAAINNGYPEQELRLYNPDEDSYTTITLPEGATAADIANELDDNTGVDASAETKVKLLSDNYVNSGDMNVVINGQVIEANDMEDMVSEINQYQQTSLNSITAEYNFDTGDVELTSSTGIDITVSIESPDVNDSIRVQGGDDTAPAVLGGDVDAETNALVGGYVDIILNDGFEMTNPDPRVTGLFNGLTDSSFEDYTINAFDPDDADTYNETQSLPIYDSIGNQHELRLFYVKDQADPDRPKALHDWTVYAQIDGENIGDPDTSLDFPENTEPSMASFKMFFNADGTLNKDATGDFLISNWDPIDPQTGESTGAFPGLPEAQGGDLPIPEPNVNSNFAISFDGTTQYGGPFSTYDLGQDGYATGRLEDLEIDDDGMIYGRYTNGEQSALGQVALANFENEEGLKPVGHTEWTEGSESGEAVIGKPATGRLGTVESATLEDSTVDLSEQLVHLIIAQRNYQASAKTIETTNAVTQTIINLR